MKKLKIGISACLLGERVRYDGRHKLDPFLRDTLGEYAEFVPVCPEVEAGLSTPREPMDLFGDPAQPKLLTVNTRIDLTDKMNTWVHKRIGELKDENLCGYIFKSKSPSCGLGRITVYDETGNPTSTRAGLFAAAFAAHFPHIPVAEEIELHDPAQRDHFIERVFTVQRGRDMLAKGHNLGDLG